MAFIFVPTPKTPKGRVVFGIVLAAIFLLFALIMLFAGISNTEEVPIVQQTECAYTDFETDYAYEFENVWVIGEYATWVVERDGSDRETCYYMVVFEDTDGEVCYASVEADPTSAFGKRCDAAMDNETTLELTGIYTCKKLTSLDDKIEEFYDEAYWDCVKEVSGKNLGLNFSFEGETEAAFREKKSEQATILLVLAAVFAVGSSLGLFFLIRKLKKIKKAEAEYAAAQAAYYAGVNGGYPPYNGGYPNNGYSGGGDGGFYGNNGNTQGQ